MYNLKKIMLAAWRLFRASALSFAECLKRAWRTAKANAQMIADAAGGTIVNSWHGWKEAGYEVRHGEKALFKLDLLRVDGSTIKLAFFSDSQVERGGENEN